jgi:hypothetical protein
VTVNSSMTNLRYPGLLPDLHTLKQPAHQDPYISHAFLPIYSSFFAEIIAKFAK